jgi:hypothetical protein
VAHIARSIELDAQVDSVHAQWLRFEELPASGVPGLTEKIRWRAEVLTFEPTAKGTRVTVKIEFDPTGGDPGLARRVEAVLQRFLAFLATSPEPQAA